MKEKSGNKQTEANEEIKDINSKVDEMQNAILKRLKKYFNDKLTENKIPYRTLSELSGVSVSVIADFLKDGKSMPRIETLMRLSLTIAPDDIDNMFRLMFENPDANMTATTQQLLQRILMDLGLEHNDIIDVRRYIKYLQFCAEERKQRREERQQRQERENELYNKQKTNKPKLGKSNKP